MELLAFWMMLQIVLGDDFKTMGLAVGVPILVEVCPFWMHIVEELQPSVVFLTAALDGLEMDGSLCHIIESFRGAAAGSRGLPPSSKSPQFV